MNIQPRSVPFEAYSGEKPYIFISYSHEDHFEVFEDINNLHKSNYRIWYDEGIDPGKEWPVMIEKYLLECAFFIVFITANAVESKNVRNEINLALETDKPFVAIHLEETELKYGLRLSLGSKQAILKYRMDYGMYQRKLERVLSDELPGDTKVKSSSLKDEQIKNREDREVAILASDIKGSTQFGEQLGLEEYAKFLTVITKELSRCITDFGGSVTQYSGDGLLACFSSKQSGSLNTENAICSALQMQKCFASYSEQIQQISLKTNDSMGLRIGINTGAVKLGNADGELGEIPVYGPTVHLASRIENLAPPGKILVPLIIKTYMEGKYRFVPHGKFHVKGCVDPVDTYLLESSDIIAPSIC